MSTSTALGAATEKAVADIDAIAGAVRRHSQTVEATRAIEGVLSDLAGRAPALAGSTIDEDELREWAERVQFAPLPDGSEGMSLNEWRAELGDALKCLFRVPEPAEAD